MIKLYSWSTPNGRKISILLEELNADYTIYPINLNKQEQLDKSYRKICPTNKIPTIIDTENNLAIFETGAILLYLGEKYNKFINKKKDGKLFLGLCIRCLILVQCLDKLINFFTIIQEKANMQKKNIKIMQKKYILRLKRNWNQESF